MIKALLVLIPIHTLLAQFGVWDGRDQAGLALFCVVGTLINLTLIVNWAQNTHYETIDTPANAVWSFLDLFGFYVIAASHPFFYYPSGEFFYGPPVMQFSHTSLRWIGNFHQSGVEFLQTLYAISLLGILTAALFVLGRGIYLFIFRNGPKRFKEPTQTQPHTHHKNYEPLMANIIADFQDIKARMDHIEEIQNAPIPISPTQQAKNAKKLDAFAKMLDEPKIPE